jgi:AcrR family transcriptional regulator
MDHGPRGMPHAIRTGAGRRLRRSHGVGEKYFGCTAKYGTSAPTHFQQIRTVAVKPALKEPARALKPRLPRPKQRPAAKAAQPDLVPPSAQEPVRKGDRTRLQIKAAARVIFARDGFLNSTIAEIMKEAQRSIGVFYRYYKSKDELLLELTEEFRQKLLRQIHLPLQPMQDPIENFEEKLGTFWQLYMEDWPIVNSALQMSMVDEAFAKRWHDLRQQGIGAIAHIIGKAKKLGYCSTIDPHYAASALCSMLEFTCYNWTSRWGDFAGAKMSKAVAIQTLKQIASHSIAWRVPA